MNPGSNFVLELVTAPEFELIDLAEMKRHLRCFAQVTDDDDDITALVQAAREWCEDYTGRALLAQTWRLTFGDEVLVDRMTHAHHHGFWNGFFPWRERGIYLRRSPVTAITSFKTVAADGTETALDSSTYQLREGDSKWPMVVALNGASWMRGTYRITFTAGFDEDAVPARFKQAMKLWAEAHWDRDEKMMPLLVTQAENMMRLERCHMGIA